VSAILSILKANWRLSSPALFLLLVGAGVLLLYVQRRTPWGRRWLTAVFLVYWVLATPMGSRIVAWPLARHQPRVRSAADAGGSRAVVMLGAGIVSHHADGLTLDDLDASALRVIESVRVYTLLGEPLLIVSGGNTQELDPPRTEAAAFARAAMELGVPPSHLLSETESMTTREEAVIIKRMLAARGIDAFVLVTSPLHMSRSMAAFRAVGLTPIASSTASRSGSGEQSWSLAPDRQSLRLSDAALYEYLAWAYYWSRGWVGRATP
jgi:uncharacterized SAM-binding protein YcdF (DUF218 family)